MIVGIDPSLTNTAVCCGNGDALEMRCFGSKPSGADVKSRLARYEELVARITDHLEEKSGIELILIEGYAFGAKQGREQAGEYGGLLRWHLVPLAPVIEVPPHALKKFATGKGNAEKHILAAHLASRYRVMFDNNDEFDAFGLYRLGLCYAGQCEPATQAQSEVVGMLKGGLPPPRLKKPRAPRKPKANHPLLAGQDEPDCPF